MGSPDLVMLLLCSNETLRCRLQRRAAQLGLLGDSSHALRRRLDTFQRDIVSVSKYYRQLHLLTQVDCSHTQTHTTHNKHTHNRHTQTQQRHNKHTDRHTHTINT